MAPLPKSDPVRRNSRVGPLLLPASGRQEPAPPWPLSSALSYREKDVWEQLWATPQAVAWEAMGWTRIIARYTNLVVRAEKYEAPPPLLAEVRQLEDRLGLTPKSMKALLWEICPDEVAERRNENADRSKDARKRLRAVDRPVESA